MSSVPNNTYYSAVLVPGLQKIQHDFGYLDRTAMEQFATKIGVPLYRLQAVASFFPHFNLTPPKKVTLRVCRDMACHLAGSADTLAKLKQGATASELVRSWSDALSQFRKARESVLIYK